jgi:hypothetical protein
MKLGTMPLPVDIDTLPLYLWEKWHGVLLDPQNDAAQLDTVLPWARAGNLAFWWLLLCYGRLAGRQLAGPWGGRLAVALLACEPCLLAHASLATTDVAISACLLALIYHFRTRRRAKWVVRVGLPAFWFGAAVLAKASGLVFGPICLLLVELERQLSGQAAVLQPARADNGTSWLRRPLAIWLAPPFRRDVLQLLSLGMLLVFIYCGCDFRAQPDLVSWAQGLPKGTGRQAMVWLAEHLRIFSNAGEGLVRQVKHNMHGHGTYLLGISASRSLWYYFPVALSIKLSVTLLALAVLLLITRPRSLLNWACLAALALLCFSVTCRVQIGIRLMLPLVVLAVVGLAAAFVRTCQETSPGWQRRLLAVLAAGGAAWTAAAAALVWPNGLCYVNVLWGGTESGYRCLSDSNYDWGQGLRELVRWQRRQQVPVLDVWYFGSDPAVTKPPLRLVPLHIPPAQETTALFERVRSRYLAASTTLVYGNASNSPLHQRVAAALQSRRPIDRTTTFLIYDLSQPPQAAAGPGAGGSGSPPLHGAR